MEFFIGYRNNLPCLKEENIQTIVIVFFMYGSLHYLCFRY